MALDKNIILAAEDQQARIEEFMEDIRKFFYLYRISQATSVGYIKRKSPKSKAHKYTKVCYHRNGGIESLGRYFYKDRAFIRMGDILSQKRPELRDRLGNRSGGYKNFTRNRSIRRGRTFSQALYTRKKRAQIIRLPYNWYK